MIKYIVKKIDGGITLSTEDKFEFYSFILMNDKKPYYAYTETYKGNKCVHKTAGICLDCLSWFTVDISKMFIKKQP